MNEDLDYILSIISNKLRRDIIKLVAEKGPISYTKLMKELNIKDSGTFGFHINKMKKLLRKDDVGEYTLNDLGLKAYQLIKELEGKGEIEESLEEEYEEVIISDKIRFDYTEDLAKQLIKEGKKIIFTDIVKLIIHPMPKELLNKSLKEISDCINVKVHKDLYELVNLKSRDTLNISVYKDEKDLHKKTLYIPGLSSISTIISSIMETISSIISTGRYTSKYKKKEIFLENEITFPDRFSIDISLNGGVLEITHGEGYVKAWKTGFRDPHIDYRIVDHKSEFEFSNGHFELRLPPYEMEELDINLVGGMVKIKDIKPSKLILDLNGGYVDLNISTKKTMALTSKLNGGVLKFNLGLMHPTGESSVSNSLNGGICEGRITIHENMKISLDREVYGGYIIAKIDNVKLSDKTYVEEGFEESENKLEVSIKTYGGISNLKIERVSE